jgi:hypothetical protein
MIIVNSLNPIISVFKEDNNLASPFNYSDKIHYYVKKYAPNKNDQIMFFSQNIIKYPLYNYLEKDTKIKSSTNFLEIGVYQGHSLFILLLQRPESSCFSCSGFPIPVYGFIRIFSNKCSILLRILS